MRKATFSSVVFILIGSALVFAAQLLSLQSVLPAVVSYLGFFSILAGAVILALTVLALMLPQVNRQLSLCRH